MRGIALDRFDQIGDEVETLLELHVYIGKGLLPVLTQGDQPVVNRGKKCAADDDGEQNNQRCIHGFPPCGRIYALYISILALF